MLKKERADYIQQRLNQLYPETPIPLDHKNNFELLVAVLLSAQCTDIRVNQITPALFAEADNAFDMQHVPVDSIYKIVRPCGLAPQKSSAISNLSKILVEQYNGEVPDDWGSPGVIARRRPQNCQCRYVTGLWPSGLSCGYAHPSSRSTLGPNQG